MMRPIPSLSESDINRFWNFVEKRGEGECWPWSGHVTTKGRPAMSIGGRVTISSRVSWMIERGIDPGQLCVCHSCDNPLCCNPAHLWLGTVAENNEDMIAKGRGSNQRKTHCPSGHPYCGDNLRTASNGKRYCRACDRQRWAA